MFPDPAEPFAMDDRRRRPSFPSSHSPRRFLFLLWSICCLAFASASPSPAADIYIDEQMLDAQAVSDTLLVDQRPPPNPKAWTLATENDDVVVPLQRRAGATATATVTVTQTAGATAVSQTPNPLPSPFDQGFNNNITQSCADFMYGFLANGTFRSCLPFSLLLQNSDSFFQATKSFLRISQTLDATCAADATVCTPYMTDLATNLALPANCGSDLSNQNPIIQQAHLGLLAYRPLYTASCLRDPTTASYCFADAVTNASSPTDSYIYYLPLNIALPGGSQPTCDACLQNTMTVFQQAGAQKDSALANDYEAAATQVNLQCGPGFVSANLAPAVSAAARGMPHPVSWWALVLLVVAVRLFG